ncbi:hypothetical protein F4Y43_17885 [Candidatus Poribacteria bacterium]|nr:hypothetical protein [Candidatus Poribacteria bacterium]
MKDTHFLYSVAVLAVVGITTVFVAYVTDTLPIDTPRTVPISTAQSMKKNKDCGCCAEKLDETLEKLKKQMKENKNIGDIWNELLNDL